MTKLIVNLYDFLKTRIIEVKARKYMGDTGCKSDVVVSFKAVKISDDKVYVNGKIKGSVNLECSRCLHVYSHSLEIPIDIDMCVINDCVDVDEEVRQLLLLEMPMKPLCSKDCLGICKICGRYNKKSDFCSCVEKNGELIKERWEKLLNKNNRRE
ncbi:MAG: YceD family protein [Endomicrobium sp.]|jgi:uncharacterized protein|nr:YceD family protein [Endomicrobium sp.]